MLLILLSHLLRLLQSPPTMQTCKIESVTVQMHFNDRYVCALFTWPTSRVESVNLSFCFIFLNKRKTTKYNNEKNIVLMMAYVLHIDFMRSEYGVCVSLKIILTK